MPALNRRGFAQFIELRTRIRACRFVQPIAFDRTARILDDQRTCDELRDEAADLRNVDCRVRDNAARRFQREAAEEQRDAPQDRALCLR